MRSHYVGANASVSWWSKFARGGTRRGLAGFVLAGVMTACDAEPAPQQGDGSTNTPNGFVVPSRKAVLQQAYALSEVFPSLHFDSPVSMIEVGNHMLVAERTGHIYAFERRADVTTKQLVLDLSAHAIAQKDSGLLAIAAHPQFANPESPGHGKLFAFYAYSTDPLNDIGSEHPHVLRLSSFAVDQASWLADPSSEQILIAQPDEHLWHQGGGLFFHAKDGFLYLSIGDEGGYDCTYETCQHNDVLFGGVLRIDVDQRGGDISHPIARQPRDAVTDHYFIPNDNPFVDDPAAMEELYAIGLRNPFRMTHDPIDSQVWIGDVGERLHDEINVLSKGANFQWDVMEGTEARLMPSDPARPRPGVWTDPLISYERSEVRAVIGGYVYRGSSLPSLYGRYVHADYRNGTLWATDYELHEGKVAVLDNQPILETPYADSEGGISSLAVDSVGGLYVLTVLGDAPLLSLKEAPVMLPDAPLKLSQTKLFSNLQQLTPAKGLTPYEINAPLWSDGSQKRRFMGLPGKPAEYTDQGAWDLPAGSVLVKHFELPLDERKPEQLHRLETRVLVVEDGRVYGATYRWRADQSDADLLLEHQEEQLEIIGADGTPRVQTHVYPSPSECLRCHDPAAGEALGIQTAQLNREVNGRPQLEALFEAGLLTGLPKGGSDSLPKLAGLGDMDTPAEDRVRSYLHANCSFCHGTRKIEAAAWDARITTPLAEAHILDGEVLGREGDDSLRVVAPGAPERSWLLQRVASEDRNQRMPPLGSTRPDAAFVELLTAWIASLRP
jgi:glucose/arabinose dehydrogenase